MCNRAKMNQIKEGLQFLYKYEEGGYSWYSKTMNLELYPNGICKTFDQFVLDRDTHSDS